eukprot:g13904.t1
MVMLLGFPLRTRCNSKEATDMKRAMFMWDEEPGPRSGRETAKEALGQLFEGKKEMPQMNGATLVMEDGCFLEAKKFGNALKSCATAWMWEQKDADVPFDPTTSVEKKEDKEMLLKHCVYLWDETPGMDGKTMDAFLEKLGVKKVGKPGKVLMDNSDRLEVLDMDDSDKVLEKLQAEGVLFFKEVVKFASKPDICVAGMSGHWRPTDATGTPQDLVGHTSMEFSDRESRLRSDHGTRLDELDVRTNYLTNIIAEVENIPTRRVDWHIKDSKITKPDDAAARLAELALRTRAPDAPQSEPPSWTSPIFEAAGAHELQLELQISHTPSTKAPRGDCVLSLKADPGLFLVCRLYVGAAFAQVEHTFNAQGEPVCTKPICFIRDQIDKAGAQRGRRGSPSGDGVVLRVEHGAPQEGALVVGFEVLEAIRRAKRTVPAPKDAADRGVTACRPDQEEGGQDVDVLYHRYLNHRLLDIMQDQVDLIRSGMVRRIEWRLEKASQLRKCFPENECLCSTTFEAAGVDDLQLVFYPSGYLGAKEGFCSFFLHCWAGSMIKCWLSVGKHKREAKCGFEKPGYFGRTNFCRFENSIDPDDTTLLVLEIDEAQWKIEEPMSHLSKVCTVSTKHNSRILEEDSMRSMPPSPVRRGTSAEVADPHLKSVAGALTDLLKTNGTGTAANNSAIIGTIKDLLEKNMKGHVKESFEKSVQAIEESKHEFAQCRLAYEKADPVRFPKASLLQANSTPWYEAYFQAYSQCKAWEGQVAADLTACDYYCTSQVKIMGENCTNLGLQCGPLDCAPVSGEGYKAFLDRMISDIKGQIEALQLARSGPGRYNLTHRCQDILGTAERCFKNCDGHIEERRRHFRCRQKGGMDAKCKELANQRKAWEDYDVCYDSKFPQWETTKAEQLAQMPSLQAQMRSILRMICYIEAWLLLTDERDSDALTSFGENQAAKLNQCMEKDYTKHPEVEKTTVKSHCFKKGESQTAVFWDLGSAQDAPLRSHVSRGSRGFLGCFRRVVWDIHNAKKKQHRFG